MKSVNTFAFLLMTALATLVLAASLLILPSPTLAQDPQARNWTLWLGGGAFLRPVYTGSDAMMAAPFPYFDAEYKTDPVDYFASVDDGLGLRIKNIGNSGLSFQLAANPFGRVRDPELEECNSCLFGETQDYLLDDADEVKALLEGTPTVESAYEVFATISYALPKGRVSTTVAYAPIEADYADASIADEDYSGLRISLDYENEFMLSKRLFLEFGIGTTWMNDDHAEAFYGVAYPTAQLNAYDAQAGWMDVHASASLVYFFNDHVGSLVAATVNQLMGDAADSPLTQQEFQPKLYVIVFYSF